MSLINFLNSFTAYICISAIDLQSVAYKWRIFNNNI